MQLVRTFSRLLSTATARRVAVTKGLVSPPLPLPTNVTLTPYCKNGTPEPSPEKLIVHPPETIDKLRAAGKIARAALTYAGTLAQTGVTTDSIDRKVHDFILSHGAFPSPYNYFGFPKSICTSLNEVVCHGIPDDTRLMDGDLVKIDVSIYKDGVHGDCCHTFFVGNVDEKAIKLTQTTQEALHKAIAICGPGVKFSTVGDVISSYCYERGFDVVTQYTGHGIGHNLHMLPHVFHVANNSMDKMKPGMTFTIEPMVTAGSAETEVWSDRWTVVTRDKSWAAQFEHTVLITDVGCEILTI